jgi:predicted metal-dependent hydrolase
MELNYTIVRSPKRRKLTITVERDRAVVVHAPENASAEAVRRIVDRKCQWLMTKLKHPQKYRERPHPPARKW